MRLFKILTVVLLIALVVPLSAANVRAQDQVVRITYVVNGTLGDKSFFDSGERGVQQIATDFGAKVTTVELGNDPKNWESGLSDVMAKKDYDILIAGTYQIPDYLGARADQYPDKVFIFFDSPMSYADPKICKDKCKNVYSMTYLQNQGSFVAGVYAAAMSKVKLDGMNGQGILGAIGGQPIPVIDDFVVGYQQGACLVNPKSQFLTQYVGNWTDSAKGKELALAMYQQKADLVFNIAGGAGVGMFEAAKEQSRYAIGVDSDEAAIVGETDPDQAARILTSMQKNVDNSLVYAFKLWKDGKLPVGTTQALGLAEGGIGLSINDIYKKNTPDGVQTLIKDVTDAVSKGDIKVNTAFGDPDKITKVANDCSGMAALKFDVSKYFK